jgi:uncharacterized protein
MRTQSSALQQSSPVRNRNALLALLLVVPVASFGVTISLFIAPGPVGQLVFSACKLWMLVLPGVWFLWRDREVRRNPYKFSRPKHRESLMGLTLGILMFAAIIGAYWQFGRQWIDVAEVREKAQQVGVGSFAIYLAGAVYFTLINSLIEEYVWRWFVGHQCQILVPGKAAIFLSALLFTLHHIIVLVAYTDGRTVALGSLGVFIAGSVWSWCYLRYRSIWPSYLSHVLADLALAIVAGQILFG